MVTCPKCGKSVPTWKVNASHKFQYYNMPHISAKLRANKRINSLIGGIGGGVGGRLGGLLFTLWFHTKEVVYLMLIIALFPLIFLAAWLASIKFMKLEVLG